MQKTYRIGQIVPSSNTTMETEIPAMLGKDPPDFACGAVFAVGRDFNHHRDAARAIALIN